MHNNESYVTQYLLHAYGYTNMTNNDESYLLLGQSVQGGLDGGGPGEIGGGGRLHFFDLHTAGIGGGTGGGGNTTLTGLFVGFGVDGGAVVPGTFAVVP